MYRVSFVVFAAALFPALLARGDDGRTAGGVLFVNDLCGLPGNACAQLAQSLVGPNIVVSNVQCRAKCNAIGRFSGAAQIVGFDTGIVLGTGSVTEIVGPNDSSGTTTINGLGGDPDLAALVLGRGTADAAVLEFDFQYVLGCQGMSTVYFEYVFASEEYSEYVLPESGEHYDVFGFFLNGKNLAIVPGTTSTPVSVETVNCGYFDIHCCLQSQLRDCPPFGGPNCNLFRNNSFPQIPNESCQDPGCPADINGPCPDAIPINTEMDGLTVPFTATGSVDPTGVNHIKLAIADVGDDVLDSNVFLRGGSFRCLESTGVCCDRGTSTCLENVQNADCGGEWLPGLTCDRFNPPCRKHRMLVLLDRTGSMNNIRAKTGVTRCEDALTTARMDVEDFFAINPHGEVAVWTFAGTTYTDRTGGFVGKDTALAALNDPGVATCGNLTPLAEAMCAAVDLLSVGIPNPLPGELILAVSSDGEENNSDGQCFGPRAINGTQCGQYDPGSWQQRVCSKVLGHSVVMARYWGALQFAVASSVDVETGQSQTASVPDVLFFQNLAEVTGGRYLFMDDVAGPPTGACCDPIDRCRGGLTRDACASLGGTYVGNNTDCSQVIQCAPRLVTIPTLSEWGVVAMT
jgi:hypothetical protein